MYATKLCLTSVHGYPPTCPGVRQSRGPLLQDTPQIFSFVRQVNSAPMFEDCLAGCLRAARGLFGWPAEYGPATFFRMWPVL
jgi:hypothetical protein